MKINSNPFSSPIFEDIWRKHFIPTKSIQSFDFIEGVNFYKSRFKSVLFNIGKNLTKGNYYNIKNAEDYKGKVFIIYDVPLHAKIDKHNQDANKLKVYKTNQYPGFLIDLDKFTSIDAYMQTTFGRNSRMKMRKYTKRLETCFDISTKMFHGNIDKKEYDALFEDFMGLLKRRYSDKKIENNNMRPSEWGFYKEVAYTLILDKKASLFVLYDNNVPVSITYNYHANNTVVDAMTVFDIDYTKFNIGYVNILKLLGWCFDNNVKALDFSKGYFDYKKRMCTLEYDFEYHILYDSSSIKARALALSYFKFYEFKVYLRKKDINTKLHKLTYFILNWKKKATTAKIEINNIESLPDNGLKKIDFKDASYSFLRKNINDFQYNVIKNKNEIDVYKLQNQKDSYLISSESSIQRVTFIE